MLTPSEIQAELIQSQKMEAVGQLAGGIAHDFNNLLMGLLGCAEAIGKRLPPDHDVQAPLEELRQAVLRGQALTRQLLAFARRRPSEPVAASLSEVVMRTEGMLRHLLDEDITLEIATVPGAWVLADPGQLEQVIMNLAINARDAMPEGGKLRIATSLETIEAAEAEVHGTLLSGRYVCLTVADTGCGMDEATQARAFEPFFTTKPAGEGSGLGLAMVYGCVRQAGGFVRLRSRVGEGTTFSILLPGVSTEPEVAVSHPVPGRVGHETVLVVDDEALVRTTVRRYLEASGYHVLEAGDGDEALRVAADASPPLGLLLVDVVLPRTPGPAVAEALRQRHGGLPVLYMSGYPSEKLARDGRIEAGAPCLLKPFSEGDLHASLRHVLGPEAPRPRSVLLVEDDELVREVLCDLLQREGYDVEEAGSGKIAMARLGEGGLPSLLITDLGLPDVRAVDLIARLRDRDPALPVLLISGRDSADPEVQGLLGVAATRHVQKPFHLEALLAQVEALVAMR